MRAAAVVVVLALAACGDDLPATTDGGAPIDARSFADAALIACDADVACPAGRADVCDLGRGACVECAAPSDCVGPGRLGPTCDAADGTCACDVDDDCAGKASGPRCHDVARACTCLLDDDCAGDATCELEPYLGAGVRTCRALPSAPAARSRPAIRAAAARRRPRSPPRW